MDYFKDFDKWNIRKKQTDKTKVGPIFNVGEIWWCFLGINIGIEIDGKGDLFIRPVLILKKINRHSAWILPLTSTFKDNIFIYKLITYNSNVSLSQIRNISHERFERKITSISVDEYEHIIIRLRYILSI